MARPTVPLAIRFAAKVNRDGPCAGRLGRCWLWTGMTFGFGYGMIGAGGRGGKMLVAHRAAWLLAEGPDSIPEGMCVLHRCDNPPCVRRSHLWLGTQGDNVRDAVAKGRLRGRRRVAA